MKTPLPTLSLALALIAVGCGMAGAQEATPSAPGAGVRPADLAPDPGLRLRGQGLFKYWGFEVYRARLWTTAQFQAQDHAAAPLALELEYLRSFTGRAIAERSIEEMRRVGRFNDEQAQRWLARMTAVFPNVERGHTLRGVHQPGVGAVFEHNGRYVGEIADPAFSRLFFGIWLSPQTSGPELRDALIGAPGKGG